MMPLMLADTSLTRKRGYPIIHRATTSEPEGWLSIGDAFSGLARSFAWIRDRVHQVA